ncbi:hypothetical protein GCM10010306_069250 [Streptomyces umbrinus]|nr:hypothetical protein GCM10010306_069250 [Streptomyces umbrinus]
MDQQDKGAGALFHEVDTATGDIHQSMLGARRGERVCGLRHGSSSDWGVLLSIIAPVPGGGEGRCCFGNNAPRGAPPPWICPSGGTAGATGEFWPTPNTRPGR